MLAVVLASFGVAGSGVAYTAIAAFMILVMPRTLAPLARWAERGALGIGALMDSRGLMEPIGCAGHARGPADRP